MQAVVRVTIDRKTGQRIENELSEMVGAGLEVIFARG